MIIGVCGLIGSGKGTVGDYLHGEYGFEPISFAETLKDLTAVLFSWDRDLLEGDTEKSREFRETEDLFWTKRLDYKVTPRIILQRIGTEVMRNNLHQDIWLFALERKLHEGKDYVITDVRFPNEINFIHNLKGILVRVMRGPEPDWYGDAKKTLEFYDNAAPYQSAEHMKRLWPDVHPSEWSWLNAPFDCILENNGTITDLLYKVDGMMKAIDKR